MLRVAENALREQFRPYIAWPDLLPQQRIIHYTQAGQGTLRRTLAPQEHFG